MNLEKLQENLLSCPVCLEIPKKEIYQCKNGHVICAQCLSSGVSGKCPQCRVPLDRDHATRNRSLESILDTMTFDCPQKLKGCTEKLARGSFQMHSEKECKFNKGVKHLETFQRSLVPGAKMTIYGETWQNVERFQIDICEKSDNGRILLHFNPRFGPPYIKQDANVVVRNSYYTRGWGHEERHASAPFPFGKGKLFKINIWCELNRFHVAVNDKSYVDFVYRLPLDTGNHLKVTGGVTINKVIMQL